MIGVVGGSGLYELEGLEEPRWQSVSSPFGSPSDELLRGRLSGAEVAFLPRHGRGHRIPPSDLNACANIDAFKRLGATDVLSFSAVGSLREDIPPGTFVVIDQFIDRTHRAGNTFFGTGLAAHVSMARPTCTRLGDALFLAALDAGVNVVRGGTYLVMGGPQFSTRAESELYRSWGASVIGMTNMPEAKLAREAELCYATLAMVTDFDCWHDDHSHVTVDQVLAVAAKNAANARNVLAKALERLAHRPETCPHGCVRALDNAIITAPEARDPELVAKLDAVAGRVLRGAAR